MQSENRMQFGHGGFFESAAEAFFISGGVFIVPQNYCRTVVKFFYRIEGYVAVELPTDAVIYRIK